MYAQPSYMLEELVFGYLTHSGFSETARLAARDMMGGAREVSAFDVESVKRRREISDCIAAGDVDRCQLHMDHEVSQSHITWCVMGSSSSGGEKAPTIDCSCDLLPAHQQGPATLHCSQGSARPLWL